MPGDKAPLGIEEYGGGKSSDVECRKGLGWIGLPTEQGGFAERFLQPEARILEVPVYREAHDDEIGRRRVRRQIVDRNQGGAAGAAPGRPLPRRSPRSVEAPSRVCAASMAGSLSGWGPHGAAAAAGSSAPALPARQSTTRIAHQMRWTGIAVRVRISMRSRRASASRERFVERFHDELPEFRLESPGRIGCRCVRSMQGLRRDR